LVVKKLPKISKTYSGGPNELESIYKIEERLTPLLPCNGGKYAVMRTFFKISNLLIPYHCSITPEENEMDGRRYGAV